MEADERSLLLVAHFPQQQDSWRSVVAVLLVISPSTCYNYKARPTVLPLQHLSGNIFFKLIVTIFRTSRASGTQDVPVLEARHTGTQDDLAPTARHTGTHSTEVDLALTARPTGTHSNDDVTPRPTALTRHSQHRTAPCPQYVTEFHRFSLIWPHYAPLQPTT